MAQSFLAAKEYLDRLQQGTLLPNKTFLVQYQEGEAKGEVTVTIHQIEALERERLQLRIAQPHLVDQTVKNLAKFAVKRLLADNSKGAFTPQHFGIRAHSIPIAASYAIADYQNLVRAYDSLQQKADQVMELLYSGQVKEAKAMAADLEKTEAALDPDKRNWGRFVAVVMAQ